MENRAHSQVLGFDRLCMQPNRRAVLGLGIATSLMLCKRQSHAAQILITRVYSPQLESRVRHWRRASGWHLKVLATSRHPNVQAFRRTVEKIPRSQPPIKLIKSVNQVVNGAAPYVSDYQSSLARDHWASPTEFLQRGGDCEDFAITKAAALCCLGWSSDKMYLAVGELHKPGTKPQGHGVLVTILGDSLDSHLVLNHGTDIVVSLKDFKEFKPIYGVEDRGALMFVASRP